MAEEDVQKVEVQNKEEMAKSIADKITNQQQSTFNALSQSAISTTQSTTIVQTDNIVDSIQESAQSTTDSINSMMDVQTAGAAAEKALAIESRREGDTNLNIKKKIPAASNKANNKKKILDLTFLPNI